MVWKWQGELTPYGEKLRNEAFENINFQDYSMDITNAEAKWECRVTRRGRGHKERRCFFNKDIIDGSVFGGCSCGIPYTDGIPCHHMVMVAVVKSSRIEGLTATNSMPIWWSTECWRKQYPADTNVICDFDMDMLRAFPEDVAMKYCPPYVAARKAGHPKTDKHIKSPLEGKKKRRIL